MGLSIDEYSKALESLDVALSLYNGTAATNDETRKVIRDACIQRFEYCIELAWKTSMKLLGSQTVAAKPAIREMARSNLIHNPEVWLTFIDARNETSHSYDEDVAQKVFRRIELFQPEAKTLLKNLNKIL